MSKVRNWLERLGEKIPGYSGYAARERRRDIDKLHREHLADRLRATKQPLTELVRELSSTGRLMEVGPVDRVQKKIDQLENRLRFAAYGYSGFFDAVKVEESQLDALYEFDLALVERVEELERLARELPTRVAGGGVKESAAEIERAADALNRTLDERHRVMDNYGQSGSSNSNGAPGQPLFS